MHLILIFPPVTGDICLEGRMSQCPARGHKPRHELCEVLREELMVSNVEKTFGILP